MNRQTAIEYCQIESTNLGVTFHSVLDVYDDGQDIEVTWVYIEDGEELEDIIRFNKNYL